MLLTVLHAALILASPPVELRVQPGTARPGDVVLITVKGSEREPRGTLGSFDLDFYPFSQGYQAVVGLPVEAKPGSLELAVLLVSQNQELELGGSVEVVEPNFPAKELTVAKKFISPSKAQQKWSAADQIAFNQAFAQERNERFFAQNFVWPRPPFVSAPFGDLRLFNGRKQSQHFGTDLDSETGDPVLATNDGLVVMTRNCFGSGNTVVLFHGEGLYTAYFHLSRIDVKAGEKISQGVQLGLVGATGRVTGPHLHWGAKITGRWVDAASLLTLDFE